MTPDSGEFVDPLWLGIIRSRAETGINPERVASDVLGETVRQVDVLHSLVRAMFSAEHVDLHRRQFIYRSGPQDWDAEPMSDAQHRTLTAVLFGSSGRVSGE